MRTYKDHGTGCHLTPCRRPHGEGVTYSRLYQKQTQLSFLEALSFHGASCPSLLLGNSSSISISPPSLEVLLAAAGKVHRGTWLGRGPGCSCLPASSASPWRLPENSLLRPCVAPDDRSLCPCPSLFRDSGVGFSSGILLRMEKRKKHHRRQMALTQRRHLAENRVKNPRTHGLNFSQLTQECNKSGP